MDLGVMASHICKLINKSIRFMFVIAVSEWYSHDPENYACAFNGHDLNPCTIRSITITYKLCFAITILC